jgi:tRNA threonylcarbamoyl adenosine modification protein YeaZ
MTAKRKNLVKAETILGINTSISTTQVVLIQGKKNIVSKSWKANYDEMEKIMPVVDAALKKVKRSVQKIVIINGPGPFTSLRIGVALANTLAYALNAKVFSIDTWEYFKEVVPKKLQKNTATILRAGGEYVAVKLPAKKTSTRVHINEVEKFLQKHSSIKYIAGDVPAAQKKAMKLPKNVKWHNSKTLSTFNEIIHSVDWKKMRSPKKNIVTPKYLLPPKITQSKKPVFV